MNLFLAEISARWKIANTWPEAPTSLLKGNRDRQDLANLAASGCQMLVTNVCLDTLARLSLISSASLAVESVLIAYSTVGVFQSGSSSTLSLWLAVQELRLS